MYALQQNLYAGLGLGWRDVFTIALITAQMLLTLAAILSVVLDRGDG